MGFASQLYLLTWKNWVHRKRKKVRLLVELCWPLFIFIIIVLVRRSEPPEYKEECHFYSRALFSAGWLPTLQSFVCDSQHQCHSNTTPGENAGSINDFQSSGLNKILWDVEQIFSNSTVIEEGSKLWIQVSDIANRLDQDQWQELPSSLPQDKSLADYLENPTEVKNLMTDELNLTPDVADALLNAPITPQQIFELFEGDEYKSIACNATALKAVLDISDPALLDKTKRELCDLTTDDWNKLGEDIVRNIDWTQLLAGTDTLDPTSLENLDPSSYADLDPKKLEELTTQLQNAGLTAVENFPLSSVINNPNQLQTFLTQNISLSDGATNALLQSSTSVKELQLLSEGSAMRPIVCNTTTLREYVDVADPSSLQTLSDSLCNLTDAQLDELSQAVSKQVNVTTFLKLFNVTDTESAMNLFVELSDVAKEIQDLQSIEVYIQDIQTQLGNTDMQALVCGLSTDNDLLAGQVDGQHEGGLDGGETRVSSSTPSMKDSCSLGTFNFTGALETYDGCPLDLMEDSDDPCVVVLMRMLKPLLQGAILYTPNNEATNIIIEKAKAPFDTLWMVNDLAERWLAYSPRLRQLISPDGQLGQLEKTLQNPVVRAALEEAYEAAANQSDVDFSKTIDIVESINTTEWLQVLDALDNVANITIKMLKCIKIDRFLGMESEETMLEEASKLLTNETFWAGVVFIDMEGAGSTIPGHVKYKIRMDSDRVEKTRYLTDRYWSPGPRGGVSFDLKYIQSGFVYVQDMIEQGIIKASTGVEKAGAGIYVQQFPYPCYIDDLFVFELSGALPLWMTISWVYSVAMIIKSIVYEKEKRLKEVMKVMGLSNGVHWVAWMINSFTVMFLSSILLIIVIKQGDLLIYSDPFVLLFFFSSFSISTIALCFLISVFFSRANLAAACGAVFYFATYVPYTMVYSWDEYMSTGAKFTVSLCNTIAFGYGTTYLSLYEIQGTGVQWSNIAKSPVTGDNGFGFLQSIIMMWVDTVIYLILVWYIEAVFPGQYGMPRDWYFPFTKSYWFGKSANIDNSDACELGRISDDDPTIFERDPEHLKLGVSIRNLVKVYKLGKKTAVDGLNLNFYEDQITSFLGHNGAGKTTTMSILTGLFPPTSGSAYIYGKDVRKEIDEIRRSLGTCPQHNVLFDDMSVIEHLWFYARLKGASDKDVLIEMEQILEDIGLPHKRHELSKNLSGGMKRKLSIAMAFVAGSRTVVLDEPTAGVDPYARREIWDLLSKYRKGRTIIMSTHHMDEADILGDRIAIISQGKLCCCGTSLFLKSRFGQGYYLVLAKRVGKGNPKIADLEMKVKGVMDIPALNDITLNLEDLDKDEGVGSETASESATEYPVNLEGATGACGGTDITDHGHCSEVELTKFIQRHIPDAKVNETFGTEVSYILPTLAAKGGAFEALFKDLENNLDLLHINSYGISDTTLEEVFLSVAEETGVDSAEGEILTDSGRLPRPFLGRGSLRRRSYRMPNLSCSDDQQTLLDDDECDNVHLEALNREEQEEDVFPSIAETEKTSTTPTTPSEVDILDEGAVSFGSRKQHRNYMSLSTQENILGEERRVKGINLIRRQFWALFIKRFHHARRSKKGVFAQVILPVAFVCISMLFAIIIPPLSQPRSLALVPWNYDPNNVFYSNDAPSNLFAAEMEDNLVNYPGIGTRCMDGNPVPDKPCDPENATMWTRLGQSVDTSQSCSCETGYQVCPSGAEGPEPPHRVTESTDTLYNLTGRNISDYLVKTMEDFILQRFGGFSFLEVADFSNLTRNISNEIIANLSGTNLEEQFPEADPDLIPSVDTIKEIYEVLQDLTERYNSKVWWNNNGWHALPTYISVMNNMLYRANVNSSQLSSYGITAYNHPLNYTQVQLNEKALLRSSIEVAVATFVVFAMAFIPSSFIVFLIGERTSKAKHLQMVSGINPTIYWVANFCWDLVNYIIPACLVICVFLIFQQDSYVGPHNLPCLILLLILYGWAITPLMYPATFVFSVPSTAYVALASANIVIGIVTMSATFILEFLSEDEHLTNVNNMLKILFLVFPQYCLGRGLIDMATNQLYADTFSKYTGFYEFSSPLNWEKVGRNLFALLLEGFIFFALTLLIQYKFFVRPRHIEPPKNIREEPEDEDVARERQRVLSGRASTDLMRLENLTKVYRTSRGLNLAVDGITFGIPKGECFGLLGVNGAGKTTTFKMLTGDTNVTCGTAYVNSYSILTDMVKVNQNMGYCPQFDALDSLLTGREHLEFYARLRGVPEEDIKKEAENGIKRLGLVQYADRSAGSYSGGNKRKLSTAIALIGNPAIVFLDEPTTGMDPKARRFLWNCITSMVKEGRSVILTSHSMEECEALCTRIAIMVNGRFKCLGNIQHLKNKFGDGYTITIRVGGHQPQLRPVIDFMSHTFPHANLKEYHHNMMEFQIPSPKTFLSKLFGQLEAYKQRLNIEDYSVSQTTLDQVFISFAKQQKTGDELAFNEDDTADDPVSNQIQLTSGGVRFHNRQVSVEENYGGYSNPIYSRAVPEAATTAEAPRNQHGFSNPMFHVANASSNSSQC
ncbi:phospholipid-transporting ATPase ABCA1-like isoform X2 [Anneissia japonica]|uniref:phospholipid-transporting ATPase ABCA1-like isoform X2 n=1 Tax=Anneissia japonica TaxID=1529436 RepID=UPI0014259688|nr:phospholipid-transporting ATPase ABCA1-like isoform X2 [Anneissia japonica]